HCLRPRYLPRGGHLECRLCHLQSGMKRLPIGGLLLALGLAQLPVSAQDTPEVRKPFRLNEDDRPIPRAVPVERGNKPIPRAIPVERPGAATPAPNTVPSPRPMTSPEAVEPGDIKIA